MDGLLRNCATGCRVDEAFTMDDLVDSISADTSGLRCGHVQLRIVFITPAVEQLSLEWSAPEEPTRSRLDEWFLPGRHQVYQAELLRALDEAGHDSATFKELRSATDLALRPAKTTAQAIGRSMASLVVLEAQPDRDQRRGQGRLP
ncbi:hypothetical protein DPX16_21820 [Anabarilius grahami]|uniref:Uncharacterized protein n=1 Tax=Anabarilius grahami TaxID=495550 RepID=A0A3N0YQB2_ANAGA|nr:hypothetical protein DPX16_21820 [Anabarilius grahami]